MRLRPFAWILGTALLGSLVADDAMAQRFGGRPGPRSGPSLRDRSGPSIGERPGTPLGDSRDGVGDRSRSVRDGEHRPDLQTDRRENRPEAGERRPEMTDRELGSRTPREPEERERVDGSVRREDLNRFLGLPEHQPVRDPENRPRNDYHWAGNEPFTAAWYADHPNAWRYSHPHADAFAVATWDSVYRWLGLAATPVYYTPAPTTATVIVEGQVPQSSENEEQVTSEESVNNQPMAERLVATGQQPVAEDSEWLPLGVFSLRPSAMPEANQLVQLAVNREGIVRGSYVDLVTDQAFNAVGSVDRDSQRVAWTVESKKAATFETSVASLTQPQAALTLRFPDGHVQNWSMQQASK